MKDNIFNLDTYNRQDIPEYDICIVGSGPAGMVLCSQLSESGFKIAVIESGDFKYKESSDNLYFSTEQVGMEIKPYSRVRAFGGTSNTRFFKKGFCECYRLAFGIF